MEKLPKDIIYELAKNLDYANTLKLCSGNERFQKICNTAEFWNYKIQQQYPDEVVPEEPDPRDAYILLEARALEKEAKKFMFNAYDKDPEYNRLYGEETELLDQISALEVKLRPIQKAKAAIEKEYKNKANKLSERASILENLVEMKKPKTEKYRYWGIRTTEEALEEIGDLLEHGNIEPLEAYLDTTFRIKNLRAGDLIGVSHVDDKANALPNFLIYFYERPSKKTGKKTGKKMKLTFDWKPVDAEYFRENPMKELPDALLKDMGRKNWTLKDLKDNYHLPFETVEEEEPEEYEAEISSEDEKPGKKPLGKYVEEPSSEDE